MFTRIEMFQFSIPGIPVPQKQTRFACSCGRGHCYDPSAKDKQRIQWQIKPFAPIEPFTGPVEMTIVFFLPIPKGTSSANRAKMLNRTILPNKRPDEDNLAYLVTNALKEIVYADDKQICAKHVYKFYGEEPKTIIQIVPLLQNDPLGTENGNDI
jgi:Holliday junction resolvase RusA-like endonuclease